MYISKNEVINTPRKEKRGSAESHHSIRVDMFTLLQLSSVGRIHSVRRGNKSTIIPEAKNSTSSLYFHSFEELTASKYHGNLFLGELFITGDRL